MLDLEESHGQIPLPHGEDGTCISFVAERRKLGLSICIITSFNFRVRSDHAAKGGDLLLSTQHPEACPTTERSEPEPLAPTHPTPRPNEENGEAYILQDVRVGLSPKNRANEELKDAVDALETVSHRRLARDTNGSESMANITGRPPNPTFK
ncbi:hypothetical protein FRC00_008606, partial [Tulasnella sp. 408]